MAGKGDVGRVKSRRRFCGWRHVWLGGSGELAKRISDPMGWVLPSYLSFLIYFHLYIANMLFVHWYMASPCLGLA